MLQGVHCVHIRAPAEEPLEELRLDAGALPGVAVEDRRGGLHAVGVHLAVQLVLTFPLVPVPVAQGHSRAAQDNHRAGYDGEDQGQQLKGPVISVSHLTASIL